MNGDSSIKDEQKTHFTTREGTYNLMTSVEYYRPNRSNFAAAPIPLSLVRLSFVSVPGSRESIERLCLNIGKDLFVFVYKGVRSGTDMTNQIERKSYKVMNPTCHNFNTFYSTPDSLPLLVGFNTGIVTMQDLMQKDVYKTFNEDKLVDKSKVTCIQWVPNSKQLFLSAHASGQLYLYNKELPCDLTSPVYQLFKSGDGYTIHVCKTKSTRNPLYRWVIGIDSCINQFAFSPCNMYLAVVSSDGFLRVFHYDTMELVGIARSYFGGLLCVCWSPDGRYVAVGGEDDLVSLWSFHEKQIVCRGQGHRSWINAVAFDPYTSSYLDPPSENCLSTCYRLGSAGQDTQLCLWDITDDVLRQSVVCNAVSINSKANNGHYDLGETSNGDIRGTLSNHTVCGSKSKSAANHINHNNNVKDRPSGSTSSAGSSKASFTQRLVSFSFGDRRDAKRATHDHVDRRSELEDPMKLIGTAACPRFDQCPLLEPLVCKKVSNERLSALVFKEDCLLTTCYDGSVYTWARPGKAQQMNADNFISDNTLTTEVATSTEDTHADI